MTDRGDAPVPAALMLILLLAAAVSAAQQVVVEQCRKEESDDARIACLERALTGPEAVANEKPEPDPEPRPVSRPEPEPPPASSPASNAAEPVDTDPAHAAIGAEQLRARGETAADREARLASAAGLKVAAYGAVPYQRLTVELENGQVWQQIKGDTQHVRVDLERNQTVDIEESTLGGYKLRLNEIRRTIRVERIR